MNEPLELSQSEEPLAGLTAELLPPEPDAPAASPSAVAPSWLRLAYAVEFLIALIAILNLWSEVGGQGHLDIMPWYIKLACIVGLAWCCVRFTAGIVEQNKIWTRRTIAWLAGILLFGIAMGGITYYYHLHEEPDDDDGDSSAASIHAATPGVFFDDACTGKNNGFPIRFVERSSGCLGG
ncbi:MAG TPA: hypothetical protein VME17_03575 [Bryobacteraceae bacterium]|nr:hypothetical protein [Bryobacteraceae bacterium]